MPPKGKAKGKGKSTGVEINGVNTADMTREQLEIFALRLKEELEREREERNFFQLERDKIRTCLELSRDQLAQARQRLLHQETALDAGDEQNEADTKDFQQEVRYIEFEHGRKVADIEEKAAASMQRADEEYSKQECQLFREKTALKQELLSVEHGHMEEKQRMRAEVDADIHSIRTRFEQMRRDSEKQLTAIYRNMQSELTAVHGMEMHEIAERKGRQIAQLEEEHATFLDELHELYDTITMNNFAVIDSLKALIDKLSAVNTELQQCIADIRRQNRSLLEPLRQARHEKLLLDIQYQHYTRDQLLLRHLAQQLEDARHGYEQCIAAMQQMNASLAELRQERDQLQHGLLHGTRTFKHKLHRRTQLYHGHMALLQARLARKDAYLQPLMAGVACSFRDIERTLEQKDRTIEKLRGAVAEAATAHDQTAATLDWQLYNIGVPAHDSGYKALKVCKLVLH